MISNVLFVNQKGDVVISRTYREGAPQKVIDLFRHQVSGREGEGAGGRAKEWRSNSKPRFYEDRTSSLSDSRTVCWRSLSHSLSLSAQVIAGKEASRSPVKIIEGYAFMFIKHGNMYAVRDLCAARAPQALGWRPALRPLSGCCPFVVQVAVSSGNAQAALAFQFLHDVVKLLKSYFGDFTEGEDALWAVVSRLLARALH
eukprot:scaffold268862_cov30-Tisochrysis_lutea.AAC.1